jgi:tetratricopeptide (TPR) repeat protein
MFQVKHFVSSGILVAVALSGPVFAQDLDRIYAKGKGTPDRGTVTKISPEVVTMDNGGLEKEYKVNEILRLSYGDDPQELENGRNAALTGQYEQAMENLDEIDVAKVSREVVRQDIAYYKAFAAAKQALSGGVSEADKKKARDEMIKFATDYSGSFHFYEAARIIGDLEASLGNYGDAAKYYTSFGRASFPEYKLEAALLSADAYVGAGNFDEAKTRYAYVVRDNNVAGQEVQQMKDLAAVGVARCKAKDDPATAIKDLEEIIKKGDPADSRLFGKAYNAMGNCYLTNSKTQDALLAFLHTHVLFYSDADMHAEALYHLGNLWAEVNQADRAVDARNLLKQRYGSTAWARKE